MTASTIVRAEPTTAGARRAMVDNQIRTYDVTDQRVLEAFEVVPRELFVAPAHADLAYSDGVLSVTGSNGARRVLLAPMVLARMIQGLDLKSTDRILVVAAGSGYAAAIVAEICSTVTALEVDPAFVEQAASNFRALGNTVAHAVQGPLDRGYASNAPYTAILVCGAVERDLTELLGQLDDGGRLVAIQTASHEATRRTGKAVRYDRLASEISSRVLFDAFAPVLEAFRQEPTFVF